MGKFILKRIGLACITIFLVTAAIFFMTHILPGNAAERILGPFAERSNVIALEKELGLDRPIHVQYFNWIKQTLSGSFGDSVQFKSPVEGVLFPSMLYSLRLASLAFVIVVPLSVIGGVIAAINRGKLIDRIISVGGLSAAVVPEFVWAVVLLLLFGVVFRIFPISAMPDEGAGGFLQSIWHLILPSIALFLVLFGYIARITRAGVIEALDSDYMRTAVLKGYSRRKAVTNHVLRNAMLPTIAVVASQIPYLIGGLVAVEIVFNYRGFGTVLLTAVGGRDYAVLQSGVILTSVVIVVFQLIADVLFAVLNPRIRQRISE